MDEEERKLLRLIDRRVTWIARTVIGCIAFVVAFYVEHSDKIRNAWGLSDDGSLWLAIAAGFVVAVILGTSFKQS